jgi:hypothetical protein
MEIEIETKNYLTELGEIDGTQTVAILNDQSTLHVVTRKDPLMNWQRQRQRQSKMRYQPLLSITAIHQTPSKALCQTVAL